MINPLLLTKLNCLKRISGISSAALVVPLIFHTRRPDVFAQWASQCRAAICSIWEKWTFKAAAACHQTALRLLPRSGEVKDEESKQFPTSCSASLRRHTLPLSCVFPSICVHGVCVRAESTGVCDLRSERPVERLQTSDLHKHSVSASRHRHTHRHLTSFILKHFTLESVNDCSCNKRRLWRVWRRGRSD